MHVQLSLITIFCLMYRAEFKCSATSYYKNCWIRRFPGIFVDIGESQKRGAQLLKIYQEETALECSRTCCLTRNFSCNLAAFHYDTSRENVNCYHLNCPKLESCIFSQRSNVILYNITKSVDPDLLVFGKHILANVRAQTSIYSRINNSEPLASDKRQFNRPPVPQVATLTLIQITKNPSKGKSLTAIVQSSSKPSKQAPTLSTVSTTGTHLAVKTQTSSTPYLKIKTTETSPIKSTTLSPFTLLTRSAILFTRMEPMIQPDSQTTTTTTTTIITSTTTTTSSEPRTVSNAHIATSLSIHSRPTISQTSMTPPPNIAGSEYPNDTKGYLARNHTAEGDQEASEEGATGWDMAVQTIVVAVATCITVLLSCCFSIFVVVSWRALEKRKGCYKTAWRGKRGSMQLIKYVLVRERN